MEQIILTNHYNTIEVPQTNLEMNTMGRYMFMIRTLSYPNFIRELLLGGMQPLIDRFKVVGTLRCTICEVPRRAGNQKEALLRNP